MENCAYLPRWLLSQIIIFFFINMHHSATYWLNLKATLCHDEELIGICEFKIS